MKLCRFQADGRPEAGFFDDGVIISIRAAAETYQQNTGKQLDLPDDDNLLALLPPDGPACAAAQELADWVAKSAESLGDSMAIQADGVQLLVPVPRPPKLFCLAGNYAAHVEEGGEKAVERQQTFPYVFMKPQTTTLTHPGQPVRLPAVSPSSIDYEIELAVVIGRRAKSVSEAEALDYVAGYTVVNDISNRVFRPNADRRKRDKDSFFDWLHGKWHDGFCPCGPCIVSKNAVADPQNLPMQLRVNDQLRQDASTAQQVFPVAAVIEFISSFVTLEPGDLISTGTPAGVGHPKGIYLQPGDRVEATIGSIGTLVTPFVAE